MENNKILLMTVLTLFFVQDLMAQEKTDKTIMYKSRITTQGKIPEKLTGFLYAIQDSSLSITSSYLGGDRAVSNIDIQQLNFDEIKMIKLRKRGKLGQSIVFGAISGLIVGVIAGFADGDDPPCGSGSWLLPCKEKTAGEKALSYGIAGAFYGGILGAVFGSFKI